MTFLKNLDPKIRNSLIVSQFIILVFVGYNLYSYDSKTDLINLVDNRVDWTGEIIATLSGGRAYAIKKMPDDIGYQYFLAERTDGKDMWLSGLVKVIGKWQSVDCEAYQTIFNGCIPTVEIESIELIK